MWIIMQMRKYICTPRWLPFPKSGHLMLIKQRKSIPIIIVFVFMCLLRITDFCYQSCILGLYNIRGHTRPFVEVSKPEQGSPPATQIIEPSSTPGSNTLGKKKGFSHQSCSITQAKCSPLFHLNWHWMAVKVGIGIQMECSFMSKSVKFPLCSFGRRVWMVLIICKQRKRKPE